MSILSLPTLNAMLIKAVTTVIPAPYPFFKSTQVNPNDPESSVDKLSLPRRTTARIFRPVTRYQRHTLHYVLKSFGYMPVFMLERLNKYIDAPTVNQYPQADAHLRLIIGVNNKIKRPLQVSQLERLRERFATDGVAMQSPQVWRQPSLYDKIKNKKTPKAVSWQDKFIADADGGEMSIRCYQAGFDRDFGDRHCVDKPIVLYFHGGGFCIGDTDTHHEFCHTVSARTGWSVISVNYRLAPEYLAPTAIRDGIAAYVWLTKHAYTFGASADCILIAGDSAGGCLAALVAQQVTISTAATGMSAAAEQQYIETLDEFTADIFWQVKDLPRPFAQWPLYPVTDVEVDYHSWAIYGEGLLLDHDDVVVFDAAYLQNSPLSYEHVLVSPMFGDNTALCPSYVVAADLDVLRDEAIAYAEQLQSFGINVQTYTAVGVPHGFIHFMSVHRGIGRKTAHIIDDFASFVTQLLTTNKAAEANPKCDE